MTTTKAPKAPKAPKPIKHDASAYRNRGCRCPVCTRAHADYMRPRVAAYRARKRAERS